MKSRKLKDKILKEMVTNLDIVQGRLRDEIYEDISKKELKPQFQSMDPWELLNYIEKRIRECKEVKDDPGQSY